MREFIDNRKAGLKGLLDIIISVTKGHVSPGEPWPGTSGIACSFVREVYIIHLTQSSRII